MRLQTKFAGNHGLRRMMASYEYTQGQANARYRLWHNLPTAIRGPVINLAKKSQNTPLFKIAGRFCYFIPLFHLLFLSKRFFYPFRLDGALYIPYHTMLIEMDAVINKYTECSMYMYNE